MPIVGTKVIVDDKYVGYILEVFPPNEYHSGRFIVQVHFKYYTDNIEFWFSDYGESVVEA